MRGSNVSIRLAILTLTVSLAIAGSMSAWAQDHPRSGQIWLAAEARFVTLEVLVEQLARHRFVLLGENHGHPHHHRIQAQIIQALAQRDQQRTIAMEMLDTTQSAALRAYQQDPHADAAGLGDAVNWQSRGWPEWSLYQPIAEAAFAHGLTIIAANLPREQVRALARQGLAALPEQEAQELQLTQPLPPPGETALRRKLDEAHCGSVNDELLTTMLAAQRLRDAHMARRLRETAAADGSVLIAGNGHVGWHHGVPLYLHRAGETGDIFSVALVALDDAGDAHHGDQAHDFGGDYDAVWYSDPHPDPPPDGCPQH
jgi:uncharacterized iron-regulated protein